MTPSQLLWSAALEHLRGQMTKSTYETWLQNTHAVFPVDEQVNGKLVVGTDSPQAKAWLEGRLLTTVRRAVSSIAGVEVEIEFVVESSVPPGEAETGEDVVLEQDLIKDFEGTVSPGKQGKKTTQDVLNFDPTLKGWVKHSHYDAIFRRAYMSTLFGPAGVVAFSVWDYIRAQFKESVLPWSPKIQVYPRLLAQECGNRKSKQIITGVWRKCRYFAGGKCCRRYPQSEIIGERCRYRVPGAFELLMNERMAAIEWQGATRNRVYLMQIYRCLPLLTPRQVERLSPDSQDKHKILLLELGIYRAWADREEENFLMVAQSMEGLELELASG